jgi:hypothetical protein
LSKIYGVIDRFAEDIDLSMSPAFIGTDETAFEATTSRTKRAALLVRRQTACGECTRTLLMPRMEAWRSRTTSVGARVACPGCTCTPAPAQC